MPGQPLSPELWRRGLQRPVLLCSGSVAWEHGPKPSVLTGDRQALDQADCLALCSTLDSFHGMHPPDLCLCLFLLEEMRVFFSNNF